MPNIIARVLNRYAEKKDREVGTGKYIHTNLSRLCKFCGHPVGIHSADKNQGLRPCLHGDTYPHNCYCPVFTSSPKFMSDEDFETYQAGNFTESSQKELRDRGSKSDSELKELTQKLTDKWKHK